MQEIQLVPSLTFLEENVFVQVECHLHTLRDSSDKVVAAALEEIDLPDRVLKKCNANILGHGRWKPGQKRFTVKTLMDLPIELGVPHHGLLEAVVEFGHVCGDEVSDIILCVESSGYE